MQFSSVIHPVAMLRKSLLTDNNIYYEEEYTPAEDHRLWCRLINITKFYNIPEILLDYRDWNNNTTNRCRDKMDNAVRCIQIENEMNYPQIWQKYHRIKVKHIKNINMFGFLPFLKIIKYRNQIRINLFYFIPLLKIKDKIK